MDTMPFDATRLRSLASHYGVTVIEKPNGHWQLQAGDRLVNWYPLSRYSTAYLRGAAGGKRYVSMEQALELALGRKLGAPVPVVRPSTGVRTRMRKRLMKTCDGFCHWCRVKLDDHNANLPHYPTIDHFIPLSRGGTNEPSNLVVACYACNQKRGNSMPPQIVPEKSQKSVASDAEGVPWHEDGAPRT